MSLPRYEPLHDIAGAVAMRAYGSTLTELFENAAEAMFSIGRDLAAIPPTYSHPLVAPGDTLEHLLVNWLEEVLHTGTVEGLVWSYSVVDRLEIGGVQGSASGLPHEYVASSGPTALGVERLLSDIVAIPDGHWVEILFGVGPADGDVS